MTRCIALLRALNVGGRSIGKAARATAFEATGAPPDMPTPVNLDVMLARRKMRSRELAERVGITEQNLSLLKSGTVRGVRFETLGAICEALQCQPGDLLDFVPGAEEG